MPKKQKPKPKTLQKSGNAISTQTWKTPIDANSTQSFMKHITRVIELYKSRHFPKNVPSKTGNFCVSFLFEN